jgi:glycosyltransferase involved in cell wall biosynthesis
MRVDQFVPGFTKYDAISNHVLQVRATLRNAGYESDIYGEWMDGPMSKEARPYQECPVKGDDRILLYHSSTHSDMAAWLAERAADGQRVFSDYHNITPPEYYARWAPDSTPSMVMAREELAELAPLVEVAMADSEFNEQELKDLGYAKTVTCRLLVDLDRYRDAPNQRTLARLQRQQERGGAHWLFVGRLAPNKCQHDVIAAFAVYRKLFDPKARLTLVGGITAPRYLRALQLLASDLGVSDAMETLDQVSDADLLAYFHTADVFTCLSEHEGFCVPILEAMVIGLPVVAYAVTAVPETVGDAGVLLADKDPLTVACAVADLLGAADHREKVVDAGRARARQFDLAVTSAHFLEVIQEVS